MSVLKRRLASFAGSVSGNVGLIAAVMAVPVIALMGAAVDYSRASQANYDLQNAADAAVLAAARTSGDFAAKQTVANQFFADQVRTKGGITITSSALVQMTGGLRFEAKANMPTNFIKVVGNTSVEVGVFSEVATGGKEAEVVLVLDNTGSMVNDMAQLRKGAKDLVETLFATGGTGGDLRMALVPFVAAVNVGSNFPRSMMDEAGNNPTHAEMLEWRWVARKKGCTPYYGGGGGGGGGGGPGSGGNGASLFDETKKLAFYLFQETMGVKPAAADEDGAAHGLPPGYKYDNCHAVNPGKLNNFDLFSKVGVAWKGCVEARPVPYDVDDTPPNASNPSTMFVPYFWPDEADKNVNWMPTMRNDWMADSPYLDTNVWESQNDNPWHQTYNITKYTKPKQLKIQDQPPNTKGPNASCADPIVPLTTEKTKLTDAIANLRHWNNSGTISSEGVAWGWRVLSPTPPFTEGKAYDPDKRQKIMVLMSDGQNLIGANWSDGPVISNYSAYGHLAYGQYPEANFQKATEFLNKRFELVCENAKAAGVTIYAVLFREDDKKTEQMFEKCASKPPYYYKADTAADLVKAFGDIANSIQKLRISK